MPTIPKPSVDLRSDEPVYLQIVDYLRRQVALRNLAPGAQVPAIRSLAKALNIDPGTVARAYNELKREGIITSRRGGGTFVSVEQQRLSELRQQRLSLSVGRAIQEASGMGFSREEIERAFTLQMAGLRRATASGTEEKGPAAAYQHVIRFFGSHDLAVELLATHVQTLYSDVHFSATFVGSLAGLAALECGQANMAGAHLLDEDSGQFNITFVRKLMPNESVAVINLMYRIQGLIVARGNPKHILGIRDLGRPDITFVNRQKGSGTRMLFDARLRSLGMTSDEIRGYKHEESTQTAVADTVARGQADVGLGVQSAADVAGLDFIPLLKERYDLMILRETLERSPVLRKVQETIASNDFRNMLRSIPGYDVSETGTTLTVGPTPR